MPILSRLNHREGDGFPETVTIPLDREPQALKNHGQTFQRLKERGGLAPSEAVAIMLNRKWEFLTRDKLTDYFIRFGWRIK